jgi:outer-membrane receptor for ferric coprogen and ferric-rhodotorulic acid
VPASHPRSHRPASRTHALKPPALALQAALLGLAVAASLAALAPRAHAAEPPALDNTTTRNYRIEPGPLGRALSAAAVTAGLALSFDPALTEGRSSPALAGSFTAREAFARLLADSGLELALRSDGSYTLRRAAVPAASTAGGVAAAGGISESTLPTIKVKGQHVKGGTTEGSGSYTLRNSNSATGLDLSLRDTPQSVSVITRQLIEDQAMSAVQDALQYTTAVSVQALDGGRNQVYARGFNVDNFQIDGLPTAFANVGTETGSTLIYDRVEVLRGATGLLNGIGEPSATVNLVRKRADSTVFAGTVSAEVGSWSHRAVTADLSTPLNASGTVRGRLVTHAMEEKSFRDRESKKTTLLYGVVDADLTRDTRLSIGISQQIDKRDGVYWGGLTYWYDDGTRTHWSPSTNTAANWNRWDTEERTAFVRLEHVLPSAWKLRADLAYYNKTEESKALYMSGLPDKATGLGYEPFTAHYDYGPLPQTQYAISAAGPFKLWGREHELTMGVIGSRTKYRLRAGFGTNAASIGNFNLWKGDYAEPTFEDLYVAGQSTTTRTSAYAASRLQLTDSLKLVLGTQITRWKLDEGAGAWSSGPYTASKNMLIPYGGLVYDMTRTLSLYTSYTKIFKPQTERDRNGRYLDPVDGRGLEAGVKGEFFGGRLNASAAVFRIDQNNVAVPDEDGLLVPGTPNTASQPAKGARSQGVELEGSGEVARGWNLGAGWTRYSARDAQGQNVAAQHPRQKFNVFTKYQFEGAWSGLSLGGGLVWQDTPPFVQTNPVTGLDDRVGQPAYALVDVMASYRFNPQASVQLNIKNLLNKYYYYAPWDSLTMGAPRSFTLQLKYTL